MQTLNLGIVAHVDAGKTTLTERLLHAAGVIDQLGSVDRGDTQTDTLALERERGITIRAAVVSFDIGGVTINLIDTPGHPDFIAEVDRVLGVLDGAVLVISAVEGVQAQSRVLMRALQRLEIPTLIFVNKTDRMGSRAGGVLDDIADRLTPTVVAMGSVEAEGTLEVRTLGVEDVTRWLDVLADGDEELLVRSVEHDTEISEPLVRASLREQTQKARVHPVFFGSAITGAGIDDLITGIAELLPATASDPHLPLAARIFKIDRGDRREKIAYARLFSGSVRVRQQLELPAGRSGKVTAMRVFRNGGAEPATTAVDGQIVQLWGLAEAKIGDTIGVPPGPDPDQVVALPTLESAVVPRRDGEKGRLHDALTQLAEQDPLIRLRQDDARRELYVSLYGEVQKEVIQETLWRDHRVEALFRETSPVYVERVIGSGAAAAHLGKNARPFLATLGFRVDAAPHGHGIEFRIETDARSLPLYVFKSREAFHAAMEDNVKSALEQGLAGWNVIDAVVTMTEVDYAAPGSSASDFRLLTPLVLLKALHRAGTVVCEPVHRFRLDGPADCLPRVMQTVTRFRGRPQAPEVSSTWFTLEGEIGAGTVHLLQRSIRSVTRGEGVLELVFDHYEPLEGIRPTRARTDGNPLDRDEYLLHLSGRRSG